jgi:membrane-associated protein
MVEALLELWAVIKPDALINAAISYGIHVLALIIFLETGALIFFLPGDSLLVLAGITAANMPDKLDIVMLNVVLIPCAIIGDAVSYQIGKRLGPVLFNRPKSRFFNPAHLKTASDFYEKHGGKAIIMARFAPIVRTFVPVVAGMAGMRYRDFAVYNIVGGAAWISSMSLLGYFLGGFEIVKKHTEALVLLVIFVSILPGFIEWWRVKRAARKAEAASAPPGA